MEPDYQPISKPRYLALLQRIDTAKHKRQRYYGTKKNQREMADEMRTLFIDPGDDILYMKKADALKLADKLENSPKLWVLGVYANGLASLVDANRLT